MRAFLIIAAILFFISARAQQHSITSITASYDPASIAELYDRIPIGLEIKFDNGQVKKTEGYSGGTYRWRNIKIASSAGAVQNGILLLDRQRLVKQQYKIELTITLPETTQPITTTLALPHLESIRFNHYTDSLKRGIHFYLNVEGAFSSGKIFPLDTSAVKFTADAGKLLGQDLLLNANDATTRSITVTATSKKDTTMSVSSTIPVKQLTDQ